MYGEDSCPHEYGRKQLNALKTEIYCLHVCVDGKTDKWILKSWAHTRACLVEGTWFRYYCSACSKSLTRPNEVLVAGTSPCGVYTKTLVAGTSRPNQHTKSHEGTRTLKWTDSSHEERLARDSSRMNADFSPKNINFNNFFHVSRL